MKKVFSSNREVQHVWASQAQREGYTSSRNQSFEWGVLYSYATPIANFYEHEGRKVCLITTHHYSPTTSSKHMPRVYDIPGVPIFHVPHIGVSGGQCRLPQNWIVENLQYLITEYEKLILSISRARSNTEWKHSRAQEIVETAKKHCEFFGLIFLEKQFLPIDADTLSAAKERAQKESKLKAEQTRIRNAARAVEMQQNAEKFLSGENAWLPWDFWRVAPKETCDKVRATLVARWRAGEINNTLLQNAGIVQVLLRIDGDMVETSRGARVKITTARRIEKLWEKVKGLDFVPDSAGIKVDYYDLKCITATGDLVIGCHTIEAAEAEHFSNLLNGVA